jgi:OOP family OmpA-OmpF porin
MYKENNMKKTVITLSTVVALTVSSYAGGKGVEPAEEAVEAIPATISPLPLYIGLGLVASAVSKDCACGDDDRLKDMTYGGLLRVGWDFNQYIGLEARYANASMEKDFSTTTHYGIFAKPQYHITNQMNIYGLVGYGQTTVEGCGLNDGEFEESGLSYGLGFEYDFGSDESQGQYGRMFDGQGDQEKGWGVWADYQNLFHNEGASNVKTNIFSVGVTYDF